MNIYSDYRVFIFILKMFWLIRPSSGISLSNSGAYIKPLTLYLIHSGSSINDDRVQVLSFSKYSLLFPCSWN